MLDGPADLAAMDGQATSWILKPRSSQPFNRAFRRKGFVVRTRPEAESRLAACTRAGQSMVLQEYLPGPADAHVLIDGFQDRAGVAARPAGSPAGADSIRPTSATARPASSSPSTRSREPLRSLDELLAVLGYRGMVSAEFKLDPRDGVYKLLEVNCRPFGHFESSQRWGTNLALMAYCDALGLPLPAAHAPPAGARYGYVAADTLALLAQYRRRELSAGELAAGLAGHGSAPGPSRRSTPRGVHVAELVRARVTSLSARDRRPVSSRA